MASPETPFVVEKTVTRVSSSHGLRGATVPVAAPQVDHLAPVLVHGAGGADLAALGEVAAEGVGDRPVPLVDVTPEQLRRHIDLEHHGASLDSPLMGSTGPRRWPSPMWPGKS